VTLDAEQRLRAQLEKDLAAAQKRVEAAEKARHTAIATLEQAATRGTTPGRKPQRQAPAGERRRAVEIGSEKRHSRCSPGRRIERRRRCSQPALFVASTPPRASGRSIFPVDTHPPDHRQRELAAQIAQTTFILPGTLNVVMNRCGKPRCACHADPPKLHGPYITWTRKVAGKTITRRLTPEQAERYRWFEAGRLRQLITELEELSLHASQHAEGWGGEIDPETCGKGVMPVLRSNTNTARTP
jgi:hypothetical protein